MRDSVVKRPLLLDLFCGAGGCSVGYHRAGFDVIGCDIKPSPRYPFSCWEDDAMKILDRLATGKRVRSFRASDFAVIHASPPCQRYSRAAFTADSKTRHPDLLTPVRSLLQAIGRPYMIENVDGAPVQQAIMLCGLMFGLKVFRHRWFESSHLIMVPEHPSHRGKIIGKGGMCCVVGHGGGVSRRMKEQVDRHTHGGQQNKAEWVAAMGIDWMTRNELSQAIPPAYTEFIGKRLLTSQEVADV